MTLVTATEPLLQCRSRAPSHAAHLRHMTLAVGDVGDTRRGARNTVFLCTDVSHVAGRVLGVRVRSSRSANVDEER